MRQAGICTAVVQAGICTAVALQGGVLDMTGRLGFDWGLLWHGQQVNARLVRHSYWRLADHPLIRSHLGGCLNSRPFLDPYNTAPNMKGTQKGTIILTTAHLFQGAANRASTRPL